LKALGLKYISKKFLNKEIGGLEPTLHFQSLSSALIMLKKEAQEKEQKRAMDSKFKTRMDC